MRFLYIHGFNSSPESRKSIQLRNRLAALGQAEAFFCPALSHWPEEAMALLESQVSKAGAQSITIVGSSLGGYYATALTERLGCRSVLVNPAITPHEGLRSYLGPQKNLYTGAEYELTEKHLTQLKTMYVASPVRLEHYLLIHATGDELLDWRVAKEHYRGCRQIIVDGSDHGFSEFADYIDSVLEFAAL